MKTVDELNKKPDGRYGKDKRVTSKLQEEILRSCQNIRREPTNVTKETK